LIAFSGRVESSVLNQFSDQLQRERRALVRELSQHQVLLNILTDIAGIRDTSTISRLNPSHGSADCSNEEDAWKVLPGTAPNQAPYGGTETST